MKESILKNPDVVLRFRHWLFLAMLVLLHFTLMRGTEDGWARALFVAHAGLFILWQPFLKIQHRLSAIQALGVGIVSAALATWLAWWLLAVWIAVLVGIIGGKVFYAQAHWLRRFYLGAMLYLVAIELMYAVPLMMGQPPNDGTIELLSAYGLPLILVVIAFFPVEKNAAESVQVIDFIYSLLVFLLLAILALGSIAFMYLGDFTYIEALLHTLMSITAVLLLLGFGWNPRAGFSGVGIMFSRYLMTIGMPLEQWLHDLAELSQREPDPRQFMQQVFVDIGRFPWLTGGEWSAPLWSGQFGSVGKNRIEFLAGSLQITIFSNEKLSPAMVWHCKLMTQIAGEFFTAKLRGQELKERSYMQAIHETGARLTHDVKNILQTLNLLIAAADKKSGDSDGEAALQEHAQVQALIKRQLPVISLRLMETLQKLKQPQATTDEFMPASLWWSNFLKHHQDSEIIFTEPEIDENTSVPADLFNSVAGNLIRNALDKRGLEKTLNITVSFICGKHIELSVADTGSTIPLGLAGRLFIGPVQSESGLGIGLYQAARQAQQSGYSLALKSNKNGNVRFSLQRI